MEARKTARPLIIVILAMLCASVATPCAVDDPPAVFFSVRPDAPIERYVDGQLGILQPEYARSHLVVAFRHLSGRPPSPVEREGFVDLLRHRLDEYPEEPKRVSAAEQWERLRTTIRGVKFEEAPSQHRPYPESETGQYEHYYNWIDNCTDDAFTTAAATLAARVKTFGVASPAVAAWLDAQEIVFSNCSDDTEGGVPEEAAPSLPAIIQADRDYQIAAAHFYAMNYEGARARFLNIAGNAQSPWRQTSRLVATRALVRAHSLEVDAGEEDPLALAEKELRAMLADGSMAPLHDAVWGILAYTVARRNPQQRFDEAVQGLLRGQPTVRRARTDLADYTILWEREVTGKDELTEWIGAFKDANLPHALERWQATKGMHWLVAALTHVPSDHPAVPSLLEASKKIDPASPAYVGVTHHRVRLLEDPDAKRAELDRVLARNDVPTSARNQLLAQRRDVARSLDEFLRDAPVEIVGFGFTPGSTGDPLLAAGAAVVLNYWMPVGMMLEAGTSEALPENLRWRVKEAAETRAALLKKGGDKFALAYELVKDSSRIPYVDALTEQSSQWWCAGGPPWHGETISSTPVPLFLQVEDSSDEEMDALRKLGSGASWIFRQVLARAKSHPDDPRVPEALSLAIKGTRYTCGDDDTARLARQAFQLLHRRYAETQWARDTPYWYDPRA